LKKIRIAFVGGGWILNWHARGFLRMKEHCGIVAAAEPNEQRRADIRRLCGNPNLPIYTDYNEMFNAGRFDAAVILLPHHLHVEAAVKAASHGYHVLMEKVMARNTYECQRMIDACKSAGVTLCVAHDRRYSKDWAAMRKVVASGAIGKIEHARFEYNGDSARSDSWVYYIETVGGGAMMSCMTHQLDALRWMCGEAESVYCVSQRNENKMEGDCADVATFRMESGAIAVASISWMTTVSNFLNAHKNTLWYEFNHICGEKGDVYFMHGKGTFLKLRGKDAPPEYEHAARGDFVNISRELEDSGHDGLAENYVKMLMGERHDFSSFGEDTIKTVQLAEAAYISNETRSEIKLPIPQTPWEDRVYLNKINLKT